MTFLLEAEGDRPSVGGAAMLMKMMPKCVYTVAFGQAGLRRDAAERPGD
jgi:hypothetical protein